MDFNEVKPYRGYKYLLVVVCTYLEWAEAYPSHTEWAQEVAKALLRDTVPRYGLPISIESDNGPGFVSEIIQIYPGHWESNGSFTLLTGHRTQGKLNTRIRPSRHIS